MMRAIVAVERVRLSESGSRSVFQYRVFFDDATVWLYNPTWARKWIGESFPFEDKTTDNPALEPGVAKGGVLA